METGSRKILVVDDNESLLNILSQALSRLGFEVISASNGSLALDLFLQKQYDIVLTDFDMPGMDGITLACHIKEKSPATPVILMTGNDRKSIIRQAKNSAVDLILFKPFELSAIVQTLRKTCPYCFVARN